MATKSDLHPDRIKPSKIVKSKDGTLRLFLEDGKLLIQSSRDQYPMPLDAVATLQLANMLHIYYQEVADEAKKYNGIERKGGNGKKP